MIIDISEFNAVTDWNAVKNNVEFVVIRMGYRGSKSGQITYDKKYKEHRRMCEEHGIPHSYYFFPTSVTDEEAIEEADWVAKELAGERDFPCPVFADSEQVYGDASGRADKLPVCLRTRLLQIFCERLQEKGIPAGIYASTNWLEHRLDMRYLPYSVWVAQYASKCTYSGEYIMWQYSSKGSVSGVQGFVDVSVVNGKEEPAKAFYEPQKVLDVAMQEVGYIEKKTGDQRFLYDKQTNAGSNNYTKYGYEMHQLYPATMDYPAPWCDAFVDWCFYKAYGMSNAQKLIGAFDDYTVRSAQLYKGKNAWFAHPAVGDQIFFRNSYGICHTGLVYNVDRKKVYTIEGNTSSEAGVVPNGGCVRLKSYDIGYSNIAGYGRPMYTEGATPAVDVTKFPTIRKGTLDKASVVTLQNLLTVRGYPVEIDGIFGPDTDEKVRRYQRAHRLEVDGIVGPKTWASLFGI